VLDVARAEQLLSDEHFSVDGTLIQAWAGQKSFVRKGTTPPPPDDPGNPTVNFHGEKRTNATHASITDSDALLYKKAKGHEAKLSYLGHVLIEHRHGLVVNSRLTRATGRAEWEAAWAMAKEIPGRRRATLGADKHYDDRDFVECLRTLNVTPHVAQKDITALDARTTRHSGYGVSQRFRKRVEEVFGWLKTVGLLRQTRHRGRDRVGWMFTFAVAVYNLVRLRTLRAVAA